MSFRSRLIGAWEIVAWTSTNEDDHQDILYPFGKGISGLILYTPDGYMSAFLSRSGSPVYPNGPFEGTSEECAQVARDTLAYSGPYYLEETEGDGPHQLYHHMTVSAPRNWVDTVQSRPARIVHEDGETFLHLEGPAIKDDKGITRRNRIVWKRASDNRHGKKPSGT